MFIGPEKMTCQLIQNLIEVVLERRLEVLPDIPVIVGLPSQRDVGIYHRLVHGMDELRTALQGIQHTRVLQFTQRPLMLLDDRVGHERVG